MNIKLTTPTSIHAGQLPYAEARYAHFKSWSCTCGCKDALSRDPNIEHDTVSGDAFCARCNEPAGRMVVKVQTIFGLEEDMAVLNGRFRVY